MFFVIGFNCLLFDVQHDFHICCYYFAVGSLFIFLFFFTISSNCPWCTFHILFNRKLLQLAHPRFRASGALLNSKLTLRTKICLCMYTYMYVYVYTIISVYILLHILKTNTDHWKTDKNMKGPRGHMSEVHLKEAKRTPKRTARLQHGASENDRKKPTNPTSTKTHKL